MTPPPVVTHLLRAPIVGGSELETLAIVRTIRAVRHRLLYPRRFAGWTPSILDRFPPDTEVVAAEDVETALAEVPPPLLHVQFPFLLEAHPRGLESVLELRSLPPVPTVFTVHAAVNVPVVPSVHYLFHTEALYRRFADRIPRERATICPSLVEPPQAPAGARAPRNGAVRILWVSRNEDGKFHPEVPRICDAVLQACPGAAFRFIGRPLAWDLPERPRLSVVPCPAPDLGGEYASADCFWYFPHPRLEETWCRTVTEAMGYGLPCVVAAHGGMAAQVEGGRQGLVVSSPEECVEALVALVADPPLRRAMGEAARARARRLYEEASSTIASLYARPLHLGGGREEGRAPDPKR